MASLNKVILIGRLGQDPEVRQTQGGVQVCNLRIATQRRRGTISNESEETDWHRVVLFERLADIASRYLQKGREVYIEGRLQYGTYQDKNGHEQKSIEIIASDLTLLGGAAGGREGGRDTHEARGTPPSPATSPPPDDDIPF